MIYVAGVLAWVNLKRNVIYINFFVGRSASWLGGFGYLGGSCRGFSRRFLGEVSLAATAALIQLIRTNDRVSDQFGFIALTAILGFPRTGLLAATDEDLISPMQELVAALG